MRDLVAEEPAVHGAALHNLAGRTRTLLREAALRAVHALTKAGPLTLLLAMYQIVNAVHPVLIDPDAALYGLLVAWHVSNQAGRPLSMVNALRVTGERSATVLRSSSAALLQALRTRHSAGEALYLNQAQAGYPGGMSERDAALHLLHPLDEGLEPGEGTMFMEVACEACSRPRQTNSVYEGTRQAPPYAVMCDAYPRDPGWCSALPQATCMPRSCAHPLLSLHFSRTRGTDHRGQALWQEQPGTPLILLSVAARGDPEQVLEATPSHLYGPPHRAAPLPRPPLPVAQAWDEVHSFLQSRQVIAICRVHLVRLPRAAPNKPCKPRSLSPIPG